MQNFNKKQIALAVAASLGAMAAHAGVVFQVGATVPAVAKKNAATAVAALYKAAGVTGAAAVDIQVKLNGAPVASAGLASQGVYDTVVKWNQLQSNADCTNDFVISYGTAAALIPLAELTLTDSTGAIAQGASMNTTTVGGTVFTFTLTPGASRAVRIDNATGKLQYAGTSGVFGDINVLVQRGDSIGSVATATAGGLSDSTASGFSNASAAASITTTPKTGKSLTLIAEAKTRATSGLLDGVVIDFRHPLAATPGASDIVLNPRVVGDVTQNSSAITGATGVTQTITAGAGFVLDSTGLGDTSGGLPYASGSAAPNTALTIAVTGLDKVDWMSGGASADALVYAAKNFNTGKVGATVPYVVKAWDTTAALTGKSITYANIYDETSGVALKYDSNGVDPLGNFNITTVNYKDGAAPIVVKSEFDATDSVKGTLVVTFSETLQRSDSTGVGALPGAAITPDGTEKKILNTMSFTAGGVTTSLSALGFNNEVTVGIADSANASGQTELKLTNVPIAVLNATTPNTLNVNKRITVLSPAGTDGAGAGYSSTIDKLDTAGALLGASTNLATGSNFGAPSVFETVTGSGVQITKKVVAVTFAGSKCAAFTAADENFMGQIVCTFSGAISKSSSANFTDKFLITTIDSATTPFAGTSAGQSMVNFFAQDSAVSVSGSTLTIDLPTQMKTVPASAMRLTYLDTTGMLLDSASVAIGATQNQVVSLPFASTASNQMLYTMDAKGKLVGAGNGSRMTAYIAKWIDTADQTKLKTNLFNGKITNPGDKVATDVVLTVDNAAYDHDGNATVANKTLSDLIDAQLETSKPAAVQAYVHVVRTNDTSRGNTGNSATGANADNLQWATAKINTNPTAAGGETVYVVNVDPKSGNINGRLTGAIGIKNAPSLGVVGNRGLAFVQTNGKLAFPDTTNPVGTSPAKAQAMLKADGSYRLFIGADTNDNAASLKDAFILAVLEESSSGTTTRRLVTSADALASNFVPFRTNLSQTKDAGRIDLGNITLANLVKADLATSTSWQLVGAGFLDRKAPTILAAGLPRLFVQLDTTDVVPEAVWTNDQKTGDMALSMVGNKAGVATEGTAGDTVSTFAPKGNAVAFGFMNDGGTNAKQNGTGLKSLFFMTKASEDVALPAQTWSLVSVPTSWTTSLPTGISMILKVGAGYGTSNVSWSKDAGDAAITLKANEPVFVFSKTAVPGK